MKKPIAVLLGSAAGVVLFGPAAHAGPGPTPVTVTVGDVTVTEGTDANALVPVTFSVAAGDMVCLEVMLGASGDTADPASDYLNPAIQLIFQPTDTSATATVPIVNDNVLEPTETFTVAVEQIACTPQSSLRGNVDTSDTGTVTILDDDEGPVTGSGTALESVAGSLLGLGALALAGTRVRRRPRAA